ncbi:MAG TPA: GNAT family N-acetyltransferase [Holophagaceae bacterium]|nr:GNAT family N-acetyltransferase [Holophagaceae bacterium]
MPRELRADREVVLRPLRLKHAGVLFALTRDNDRWLRRWLPWLDTVTRPEHTRAFITRMRELERTGVALTFTVWHREELVGVAGFNWIDKANRAATLGYWLAESAAGKGVMTRAVKALSAHAFGPLSLHRLEIRAAVRNRASRAIPERLGFRHEGTVRQAEWLYGKAVDHAIYGRLATD